LSDKSLAISSPKTSEKIKTKAKTTTTRTVQGQQPSQSAVITSNHHHSHQECITKMDKYVRNMHAMNHRTAYEYQLRLTNFQEFITNTYKTTLDDIISKINEGTEDAYDILNGYVIYLQTIYNISAATLKSRIITAKNFLEYHDVDISPRKFKLKVKIPKIVRKSKEPLSKEDIIDILNACSDIRLKTYVMLLAATC
jgi:integrase